MRIEAFFIGSELLRSKLNTNLIILSRKIMEIGLRPDRAVILPDREAEISGALRSSLEKSDLIFIAGGLGPTFDDNTVATVAGILRKKLLFSRPVMESISAYFVNQGKDIPRGAEKQAYVITGARILENKKGTAPGQIVELKEQKKTLILLPGPPREFESMVEGEVISFLKDRMEKRIVKNLRMNLAAVNELAVEEAIKGIRETERELEGGSIEFSILPHPGRVELEVTLEGANQLLVEEVLKKMEWDLKEILKEKIYSEGNETLAQVTARLITKHKKTLSLAESCTGGLIADLVTDVPGASLFFKEAFVLYSSGSKISLGVKETTLKKAGAVSEECCREMLEGLRSKCGTDYTLAVTGIAGPGGATGLKPLGLVYIGCGKNDSFEVRKFIFAGNRRHIKEKAAVYALEFLRRRIIDAPFSGD